MRTQDPIVVGYQPLEEVNQIAHLGSILASDRDADHDVVCQIAKAGALFGRSGRTQRSIWRGRLICSIIIPNAIYACETWKTAAKITKRLNVAQQPWLSQILRVSDHVTNVEVHRRTARPLRDILTKPQEVTFCTNSCTNCPRSLSLMSYAP